MITDAFDKSEVIFEYMLETYEHEQAGVIRCCNEVTAVYVFEIEGMKIAGYLSHIGSALAGSDVIDANWLTGADKFLQQEMYLIRRCMMFRDLQLRIIIWTNCILPLKLQRESEEKGKVEYVKIKAIQ